MGLESKKRWSDLEISAVRMIRGTERKEKSGS